MFTRCFLAKTFHSFYELIVVRLMFPCGNISVVHCVNFPHNSHIGYRFRLSHESLMFGVLFQNTSFVRFTYSPCLQAEACVSKEGRGHRRGKTSDFATLRCFPSPKITRFEPKMIFKCRFTRQIFLTHGKIVLLTHGKIGF